MRFCIVKSNLWLAFGVALSAFGFVGDADASVIFTARTSTATINCASSANPACVSQTQSTTDLNLFSVTLNGDSATSMQQSQIVGNTVSVDMRATAGFMSATASSVFQLNFTLDSDTVFTIVGSTYAYRANSASATMQLTGPTLLGPSDYACPGGGGAASCTYNNNKPDSTTTLKAGAYSFFVSANSGSPFIGQSAIGQAQVVLSFAAAPVPLPAAGWLFGSALGMLGAWTRRKRHDLNAAPLE